MMEFRFEDLNDKFCDLIVVFNLVKNEEFGCLDVDNFEVQFDYLENGFNMVIIEQQ